MWTYYAFCFPTLLLGTVKNKKRNQPFIAFDLKGFTFSFIFPLFLLVHCNIIFLKDLSCFLIFDGEINLKSEYKFQFLHGLDFHFELFFSLYHFFITPPPHHHHLGLPGYLLTIFFDCKHMVQKLCQTFFCMIPSKCVTYGG